MEELVKTSVYMEVWVNKNKHKAVASLGNAVVVDHSRFDSWGDHTPPPQPSFGYF